MATLRVGIVGGRRGGGYGRIFDAMPETELRAVCDLDPVAREKAREQGVPLVFAEYERLLASDVDVVLVATPPEFHAAQAIAALDAGKHVLSEVPAAHTLEECFRLLGAAERATARGVKYMLAENYRYRDAAEVVKRMAEDGKFGEIYNAEGEYLHEARHLQYNPDGSLTWRGRYPGILYTTHDVGPILWIMQDRVTRAVCLDTGPSRIDSRFPRSDVHAALFQTERLGLVKYRHDHLSLRPHNLPYFSIQGTNGAFEEARGLGDAPKVYVHGESPANEWEPLAKYADRYLSDEWRRIPPWAGATGHWGSDYRVAAAFVRCVLDDTAPPIGVYDALTWTIPGICALESSLRGGQPVGVPVFAPASARRG